MNSLLASISLTFLALANMSCSRTTASSAASEVSAILQNTPGIKVSSQGSLVILDGKIETFDDFKRIEKIVNHPYFKKNVVNLTTPSDSWYRNAIAEIHAQTLEFVPGVELDRLGDSIVLGGAIPTAQAGERAMIVAQLYLPDHWFNDERPVLRNFMVIMPDAGVGPIEDPKPLARAKPKKGRRLADVIEPRPECAQFDPSLRRLCESVPDSRPH